MKRSHAWSRDPAGQAAIRRAEDGRTDAVPTLEQLFAAVPWMMPKQISASVAQVPEKKGDTMPADGLRTERVTLEITHSASDDSLPVLHWDWAKILTDGKALYPRESVRVVEEFGKALPGVVKSMAAEIKRLEVDASIIRDERDSARAEASRQCDRVGELESALKAAPAANAGGESNPLHATAETLTESERTGGAAKQEPVAWGVWVRGAPYFVTWSREDAEREMKVLGDAVSGLQPLYAAPQQPRGWLTEEERKAVALAAEQAPESDFVSPSEGDWIRDVLSSILARATPPMVKVPHLDDLEADERPVWESACEAWIAAIREAGVEVAE